MELELAMFPITDAQVRNWRPISGNRTSEYDCTINVLRFFDLIDNNTSTHLSSLRNDVRQGTSYAEVKFLLSVKYPGSEFRARNITDNFINVFRNIVPGHAIFSVWHRPDNSGHAVIIAKTSTDDMVILDPQKNNLEFINGLDNLNDWARRDGYNQVFAYYFRNAIVRQNPTPKRRRSPSRTRSRTRSQSRSPQTRKKKRL